MDPFAPAPKIRNPERALKYNPTGAYDRVPDDMKVTDIIVDDTGAAIEEQVLIPCEMCGRKFREDRIEKHFDVCKRATEGSNRRGAFNTSTSSSKSGMSVCSPTRTLGAGVNNTMTSSTRSIGLSSVRSTTSTVSATSPTRAKTSILPAASVSHSTGGTKSTTGPPATATRTGNAIPSRHATTTASSTTTTTTTTANGRVSRNSNASASSGIPIFGAGR